MKRRHSISGDGGSALGTDWDSPELTPKYLKPKRRFSKKVEAVEPVDPEQGPEDKPKVETMAVHADLTERFNQLTEE